MLLITLLAIVSIALLYLLAAHMLEKTIEQTIHDENRGIFALLQQKLQTYPQTEWSAVVKSLQPKNGNEAVVLPLSSVLLSKKQQQQLQRGDMVIMSGNEFEYLGYAIRELFTYQRIAHSQFVLRLQEISILTVAEQASAWMTHLIIDHLQRISQQSWPEAINKLQVLYQVPLALVSQNEIGPILSQNNHIILGVPVGAKIENTYIKIPNSQLYLKMGPINYPLYPQYQLYILVSVFVVIAICFIIFFTFIFSGNLNKIYKITAQYSQADFATPPPVLSKHSTLRTLYNNIRRMGGNLQDLIESQKRLSRFVAHECRTPISTMLFAIDKLKQENLSDKAQSHLDNIKADLGDLNHLVKEFLNYARVSGQELKPERKVVNINAWLNVCINKYQETTIPIHLNSTITKSATFKLDPNLMKHVISNLIDNALKHAKSQIMILTNFDNTRLAIHIDDDGLIIDDAEKEKIFSPFYKLDEAENGFGLGLMIVDTIIKLHHGKITVSNSPLGGSRFSVFLPQ